MAGSAKPAGVGPEGTWLLHDYVMYDPAENLFNGYTNQWTVPESYAGSYSRTGYDYGYWNTTSHYIDLEVYENCNIWAYTHSSPSYARRLIAYDNTGGVLGDAVQTSINTTTTETWEKLFSNLPAGRYKIKLDTTDTSDNYHLDREWYIETNQAFLVQDGSDIKKYETGSWSTLGTGTPTEAMFLGSSMSLEDVTANIASLTSPNPELLVYTPSDAASVSIVEGKLVGPKLVVQNEDISLTNVENIDSFTLTATESGTGTIRIIASFDSGATWKSYYSGAWNTIDANNLAEVETDGMTVTNFNDLTPVNWGDAVTAGKVRFAYLLKIGEITDEASVDALSSQLDMKGYWIEASEDEYEYAYPANTTLELTLKANGDYKINY